MDEKLNSVPNMKTPPSTIKNMDKNLQEVLLKEDTVLFIGSGISSWSGLPSWAGLLGELADYLEASGRDADLVRRELKQDLLQAASYGFDLLTPSEIGEFMRTACRLGSAVPHEIHRKIVTLGPRCFITTNYDTLIEESLKLWQPHRRARVVTNRQPFEAADIIQARALDFIFKPHGDIGDLESIVLTREQYRLLLDGGERKHALESLKTLLVTRRVVYLGFGLRDPDFLLLRDVLANIWKGGTHDHYALMADIHSGEISYWRKNYGIHLIGYQTTQKIDGGRDHSNLFQLLDSISQPIATTPPTAAVNASPPHLINLLRHANGLMRVEKLSPEFPLRIRSTRDIASRYPYTYTPDYYNGKPISDFLDNGPQRAILVGLPGSGKTYCLRQAAARFAQSLHEACLTETGISDKITIPLFADLKLYRGDLLALLEDSLPTGISFAELTRDYRAKVMLDSFNEMSREYRDSSEYETDFMSFLDRFSNASIIIGSRTEDGLERLEIPVYSLEEIEEEFVRSELEKRRIIISGRFEREVIDLLKKPFYFQLVLSKDVRLPSQPHPKDLYKSFFGNISRAFKDRFGQELDIANALCQAAYEAINRGEEAQPVKVFVQCLASEVQSANIPNLAAEEVCNWLVSKDVLIPYSGTRASFFHQSVTEFLAATELARRYCEFPGILKSKLPLMRWDQTLFLALSLVPPEKGPSFLESLVEADFALALRASKYLEIHQETVVASLLQEFPTKIQRDNNLTLSIESALEFWVPLTEAHEIQLRMIMSYGNMVGAAAAKRLLQLRGGILKQELLETMFEHLSDYNYCSQVGRALSSSIEEGDLSALAAMADAVESDMTENVEKSSSFGLLVGLANSLANLDVLKVANEFVGQADSRRPPLARSRIICYIIRDHHTTTALNLAADLLVRGVDEAATAIYFISRFWRDGEPLRWNRFGIAHAERLIALLDGTRENNWALSALKQLCESRADLAAEVLRRIPQSPGIKRIALLYAANPSDSALLFDALEQLASLSQYDLEQQPVFLLEVMDLDWTGHESTFVSLLKLRNTSLAWALLESVEAIGILEIGPIEWWLEWLNDPQDPEKHWWFQDRLSSLFSEHLSHDNKEKFLAEFNRKESKYRAVLARTLLVKRGDITTDQFSNQATTFLLEDIHQTEISDFWGHLLGRTATETFVEERLLPLLPQANEPLRSNVLNILQQAGSRHGRRYLLS